MKARNVLPSQHYLRECFDYDPETGDLRWKVRPASHFRNSREGMGGQANANKRAGQLAGTITSYGSGGGNLFYRQVKVGGRFYRAHRIIWAWMTGDDPGDQVDHHNRDGLDNAWLNLRPATSSQNGANRLAQRNNRLGIKGVRAYKGGGNIFIARIKFRGQEVHLGTFPSALQAQRAYDQAAVWYFREFARS